MPRIKSSCHDACSRGFAVPANQDEAEESAPCDLTLGFGSSRLRTVPALGQEDPGTVLQRSHLFFELRILG
jgi:hypothetical protein